MTKRILFVFCLAIIGLSCGKEPVYQQSYTFPNGQGLMTAYISGSFWRANAGFATGNTGGTLRLAASYNTTAYFNFLIDNYAGPGYYSLGGFTQGFYVDGSGTEYQATTGVVNVLNDNGLMLQGEFYFTGTGNPGGFPITVANGKFTLYR